MTNTLRIEKLSSTYRIPRDHPAPMRLRARMDDIARNYLADCCSRAIAAAIDPHDPSVWVIDDISLDLVLDVHTAPPVDIADFWARKIASAVARVIANGADGVQVVHFPTRAAFLAHFLRLVAEDRAWHRWYFSEFAGLRGLLPGSAIREALLRESAEAEAVLIELGRTRGLPLVAAALTRADQERIISCCAKRATYSADSLKVALLMFQGARWTDRSLIGLYVGIRTECPAMPATEAAGAADHLERILSWRKSGELPGLVEKVLEDGAPGSQLTADELETARLIRLIAVTGGAQVIRALVAPTDDRVRLADDRNELESELGAVFLLAAVLMETPALLSLFGGAGDSLPRYLLYVMCFHGAFEGAWRDPALHLAAGIRDIPAAGRPWQPIGLQQVPDILRTLALPEDVGYFNANSHAMFPDFALDPEVRASLALCAAVLMRGFASRLPALGNSSIDYLWCNVLAGEARLSVTDDLIEVRLKPRALQIVLRMAGLHDRLIEVPGYSAQSFIVRFEES